MLFANRDDTAGALAAALGAADTSIHVAMYAFTDVRLLAALETKMVQPGFTLSVTLDESQYHGRYEMLLDIAAHIPPPILAVGHSPLGSIIHHKTAVIDALDVWTGSTNWTASGERPEANDLLVVRDPALAAVYISYLEALHTWVLGHPPAPAEVAG